jgi:hypothetical protein
VNADEKTAAAGLTAEEVPADCIAVAGPGPEEEAARLAGLVRAEAVDRMLADADAAGVSAEGLLSQLTRTVLERALGAELDDHLGYLRGDPAGNGSGNSRNGSYGKTITTTAGPVRIDVLWERNSSFEPKIVAKGQRRLAQVDDMILSLHARGMTTCDIQAHLAEVYGAEVSAALVSRVELDRAAHRGGGPPGYVLSIMDAGRCTTGLITYGVARAASRVIPTMARVFAAVFMVAGVAKASVLAPVSLSPGADPARRSRAPFNAYSGLSLLGPARPEGQLRTSP